MSEIRSMLGRAKRRFDRLILRAKEPLSPGDAIDDKSVQRLVAVGLGRDELLALNLVEAAVSIPAGWHERGNRILAPHGLGVPEDIITSTHGLAAASRALVVVASDVGQLAAFGCHGDDVTVYFGPGCHLPESQVNCGTGSSIVLRGRLVCTFATRIDARNGGTVFVDEDQLWASRVYIATDDMHALRDAATSERINRRGEDITIGRHVWLGEESVVMGGVQLGADTVVALRGVVRRGEYPPGVVLAGLPARVVRTEVTWSEDDLP